MPKPYVVHFVGDLPGLGEELLHKLVCNNIQCSIVDGWYDLLMAKLSTELEIFAERPCLFQEGSVNSTDVLLYFGLNGQAIDFDFLTTISSKVVLLVNGESTVQTDNDRVKVIYVHDLISYSTISNLRNESLDKLLNLCQHSDSNPKFQSNTKYWWVSQQDVAACLARLVDKLDLLSPTSSICGRRGWSEQETFNQLELLYHRTIAGSSGKFQPTHLASKPVIEPTPVKVSQITPSSRPDLSNINRALHELDGEGWRPLMPLRTSLMHYIAAVNLD